MYVMHGCCVAKCDFCLLRQNADYNLRNRDQYLQFVTFQRVFQNQDSGSFLRILIFFFTKIMFFIFLIVALLWQISYTGIIYSV